MFRESDFSEEKNKISSALGLVKDPVMIQKVLDFAISNEVRSQDSIYPILTVANTKHGREVAWQFFKDHLSLFKERYENSHLGSYLVKMVTETFASEEKALEVESFFVKNSFEGTERTVSQSVETIRMNAAWLSRDASDMRSFINAAIS